MISFFPSPSSKIMPVPNGICMDYQSFIGIGTTFELKNTLTVHRGWPGTHSIEGVISFFEAIVWSCKTMINDWREKKLTHLHTSLCLRDAKEVLRRCRTRAITSTECKMKRKKVNRRFLCSFKSSWELDKAIDFDTLFPSYFLTNCQPSLCCYDTYD